MGFEREAGGAHHALGYVLGVLCLGLVEILSKKVGFLRLVFSLGFEFGLCS